MTPRREQQYRTALERALRAGWRVLARGGSSVDAVIASVASLEDCPLFNAGKGAVLHSGRGHELDAAVMEGSTLRAGAVAGLQHVRNPVVLARLVMERTRHVLLAGAGAEAFAREQGLTMVPAEYFSTRPRLVALELAKQRERGAASGAESAAERHGTVGAVARDSEGRLAAATSTGGQTNKMPGRIGDSPIIGAGTYADDRYCAVSGTGDGELFMRRALAYDVTARMRYLACPLAIAARDALQEISAMNGEGGLVAVDRSGRLALPFTGAGMYRGYVRGEGRIVTAIY
jgi:isoaspartyl peptidase/L-asparaginase-like protein (Ntn-hydrolase superfamily)